MKKTAALIIAIILIISSVNIFASAEEDKFYVVLGDSIAFGSGLRNPAEACYGKIVADTNGFEYANHAVSGHTTDDLIGRLDEEAVISDIMRADIISVSIGGNDFLKNNPSDLIFDAVLEDDYSKFDIISGNFYKNLCLTVEKINSVNPDAVILLQTLYNPQSGELRELYQHGVDGINGMIERYAEEFPGETEIIDVNTAFGDDFSNIAKDGIHPSAKGNVIIAELILDTLFELGLGSSVEPVITEEGKDIRASISRNIAIKILIRVVKVLAFFYKSAS